jgi:hypothetical protein
MSYLGSRRFDLDHTIGQGGQRWLMRDDDQSRIRQSLAQIGSH